MDNCGLMGNPIFKQVSTECEEILRETRVLNSLMWVFVENNPQKGGYPQFEQVVLKNGFDFQNRVLP